MPRRTRKESSERQSTFAPIGFLIAWSIGISQYTINDNARLYAILDLAMCSFIIAFVWVLPTEFTYFRTLFSVVMFALGWIWFKEITGLTIFEMVSLGGLQWLQLPLLLRVMYFQLWFYISLACVGLILFTIAVIVPALKARRGQVHAESNAALSDEDHLYLNQLVNLPKLSDLRSWRLKQKSLCTICFEPLTDENRTELECGHYFHTSCLSDSTRTTIGHDATCPSCKGPVLVETSL